MFFEYYYYYIIIILPCIALALITQGIVKSRYRTYSKIPISSYMTGYDVANEILKRNGCYSTSVSMCQGELTDHYDPKTNTVFLSKEVYSSNSISACGIAAHECGHAIQHETEYIPLKIRNLIIPITNFGSKIAMPLILIGAVITFLSSTTNLYVFGDALITIGIVFYSLSTVFQLITLPVEFNASRRALKIIDEEGIVTKEEKNKARSVLSAAALTYVASLAVSLAYLLRLILIFGRRGRR